MGLPEILIEFKTKAETAVRRSQNGIVAVILTDNTKSGGEYTSTAYNYEADIDDSLWTAENRRYLKLIFKGSPKRVLAERVSSEEEYPDALARLKNKVWNWLTVPGLKKEDTEAIQEWIIEQRAANKTFKAALPCTAAELNPNNEGIVDFATDGIKSGATSFTSYEYCARIAGLLAGLSMNESATYKTLDDIDSITESTTPNEDIDSGKFILINDGEKIKVGAGVNSLHLLTGNKTEDMKKIKIVEGMDLIRDDIRITFEDNYIGVLNSYDNKQLFVAAVNNYFETLAEDGVLYNGYENSVQIDVGATRNWLTEHGYDISDLSDEEIKQARTGSYVFVEADVQFADAVENLHFTIDMN